ncbi:methylornithine synthase PylB [Desulfosporosinus sp. FKB]|uniref:methylornithine synthase PylB n=1 Tax=Desulfosporosinus sp. FKB TaxID=1969835 RepID=UPI000B497B07|nr:methylornithine synthase PylB [Desulfosporosinus sp. FKB]
MGNIILEEILEKADQEMPIKRGEVLKLLKITTMEDLQKICLTARKLRFRYFKNKLFLYGFVYFSTYCRNDCTFCLYRKSNSRIKRYRKNHEEILSTARALVDSGVHLLDFTMGEDPLFHDRTQGFYGLIQLVKEIKRETKTAIMISPGVVSTEILMNFREAGTDWYACYQETHNRSLYNRLRIEQSYDERMGQKVKAKEMGYLIEEGLLAGVGDTDEDIADSIFIMKNMKADQIRVMSFIPQANTPLANWKTNSHFRELLIIAVMRLVMPDRLIPASLDVDGINGLEQRLNSGANVITSIIPPSLGFAGVSQSTLDIDDGNRSLEKIIPVLKNIQLEPATRFEYQSWVESRRSILNAEGNGAIQCG